VFFGRFRIPSVPARPEAPARPAAPHGHDDGPGAVRFVNLTKSYRGRGGKRKFVVSGCNALFPAGRKVALLGRNGAGKSTLMRMISGNQDIDSGQIIRNGSMSWPIGFAGTFHGELTAAQNTRFVARVHGIDTDALVDYVQRFTELGDAFFDPVKTYSSGMKARLAFGVSMGVPFDCYLLDEITAVGDVTFRDKAVETFRTRLRGASAIFTTHNMQQAKQVCDMGAVVHEGRLTMYETADEAVEVHQANLRQAMK